MCVFAELQVEEEEWGRQPPREGAEESAQCQETPAREDDSDTELTYGEVEQRLDLLQQHLNRWPHLCNPPPGFILQPIVATFQRILAK